MSRFRVDLRVEVARGDHENTLPFVGSVLGQVRLYGERERGVRGRGRQSRGNKISSTRKPKIFEEYPKSIGGGASPTPLHPHPLPSIDVNYPVITLISPW